MVNGKWEMGNGKSKIYILHGWSYSVEKWTPFARELESKGFKTNLLKIPGLIEKTDRIWSMDDYVRWLGENLKREKGKIILIGHSNGGRIALNFAIKHPEKISKLVLIDSAGIFHNEIFLRTKRILFGSLAKVGTKMANSKKLRDLLYFLAREKDYKNASGNMKKTMVNLIESDIALKIDRISVPTIIIWGQDDKITPVSDGKILSEKIVNSKLHIIDDARHSPQFTHPKEVVRIIAGQLNNIAI